jgi:AraC-like DNA-binding protein
MERHVLLDEPGLRVAEVRCTGGGASWAAPEPTTAYGVVLVRRGVFRRRVDGVESLVDPVTGYVQRPGTEQRFAHPAGGDVCTSITASWPWQPPAVTGAVLVSPQVDVAHRRLIAAAKRGVDAVALADQAAALAAMVLGSDELRGDGLRCGALGGEAAAAAGPSQRRLVDRAREALHHDPNRRLTDLATELAASPYHLSRVFHRVTGVTFAGYRTRLRAQRAMDRLGQAPLARIAADLGFADQAHLTRTLRAQTGVPPRQLRKLLDPG